MNQCFPSGQEEPRVPHPSASYALGWDSPPIAIMGFSAKSQEPRAQSQHTTVHQPPPYCTTNTAVVVDTTLPAVAVIVTV